MVSTPIPMEQPTAHVVPVKPVVAPVAPIEPVPVRETKPVKAPVEDLRLQQEVLEEMQRANQPMNQPNLNQLHFGDFGVMNFQAQDDALDEERDYESNDFIGFHFGPLDAKDDEALLQSPQGSPGVQEQASTNRFHRGSESYKLK